MVRFLSAVFTAASILGLSAPSSRASEHDGNPSLCEYPWESEGSTSSVTETQRSRRIVSKCEVINSKSLNVAGNHALAAFLEEAEKDLWAIGRLPKDILYRYSLTIVNDWEKDVSVNLSHWQVVHSPYTLVARGFAVNIQACSSVRLQFLSPWAPELYGSPVNIGRMVENGEWSTIGDGTAVILTPMWYQYFSEGMTTGRLPPNEAKTKACSSK